MDHRDESFSPETVDEQIDQLLGTSQPREQEHTSSAGMVQMLLGIYEGDPRLQRVWERLAEHLPETRSGEERPPLSSEPLQQSLHSTIVRFPHERVQIMQQTPTGVQKKPRKRTSFQRSLSLLAAILVMAVLVGSLAVVLHLSHQKPTGKVGSTPSTGSTAGQVVYSASLTNGATYRPVWSADGQRIAVAGSPTLIWDAMTGKHRIAVPSSPSYLAMSAWSPTGNLLAIPTLNSILIVNGQSGQTIANYPMPTSQLASTVVPATGGYLSAQVPFGGAPTFGGLAWSPDGTLIASTFSSGTADGQVQVWNPQTGKLVFTLAKQSGYGYGAISWSSDRKYIAAIGWNWDSGGAEQINVWSVQTHSIVFQQTASQDFEGLSWQPGTDNLTTTLSSPGSNSNLPGPPNYGSAILKIWNVKTKQLLTSLDGVGSFAWSPDGKEMAYNDIVNPGEPAEITVLDFSSGQKWYTYHMTTSEGLMTNLSAPTWSPDGKYIVTIGFGPQPSPSATSQRTAMIQVWIA